MELKEQLYKAILLAMKAHEGQLDKYHKPYIGHAFRVMEAGQTIQEKIVGVLHDVVEDTHWTLEGLKNEGFSQEIIDGVDAMTHREDETYDEYLSQVEKNAIATRVKLNDLTDNMDIRRMSEITANDLPRLQKYLKAYKQLTDNQVPPLRGGI